MNKEGSTSGLAYENVVNQTMEGLITSNQVIDDLFKRAMMLEEEAKIEDEYMCQLQKNQFKVVSFSNL